MLTASMKGMVALSGLEAMSNGIQFVNNEDVALVKWGKKHYRVCMGLWNFYSGKSGIGRLVQTSFLFYGGLTTFFLAAFAIRFNVFDGTLGAPWWATWPPSGLTRCQAANFSILGLPDPGGGFAGGRFDDRLAGCTGHRMARCRHWRDP